MGTDRGSRTIRTRLLAPLLLALAVIALVVTALPGTAAARYASIVVDAASGRVLHARHADKRLYPASLTKMMTLYMLFEALDRGDLDMDTPLPVSRRAAGQPPTKLWLKRGETIAVRDAMLALITKSANDVATVVAEALGGTEIAFAQMMTGRARELGMRSTTFRNASGLHNRGQLSTAHDMVRLAVALMRDFPHYYDHFATERFRYENKTFSNHNNLLDDYDGTDGIKTGYIRASGFNLVASVKRGGHRLIGVVFGGRSVRTRDTHMEKLLDRAFARLGTERQMMASAPPVPRAKPFLGEMPPLPVAKPFRGPLPPAPRSKPTVVAGEVTEVAEGDADPQGWSVQVGAFQRLQDARATVMRATNTLGQGAATGRGAIEPFKTAKGTLYRARLAGMVEDEARRACTTLQRRAFNCMVVSPTPAVSLAEMPE